MITSAQIRAARGLLNWSRKDLAEHSGVSFASMMRLESFGGIPASNFKTLDAIKNAFENAGIEFIGSPEEGAGIRWKQGFPKS
ncbi:helix-turn-helix domain-containing protein [Polynucleobacter sp. AP-Melu-500A-A1]|uniref:helix-turn-helix domain-containing protein n=1 Tax=Polynucleobacter sp. AP-Melu-500A-A1 TaxID=2576929 RepID=UPI001C0CFEBE|nr:helix-turn-helix domain-containing protein [Polynucleobacter sp. AP-Melu-500A-A1]MBU3630096.1 helix-turn-helix transcriptional regulator [Polynucleobacter sp. AP-Melu-500A-A1]